MNLVQIQERLKDAPVQAIMQYANGNNPMVPPYLALAELKRRESINQSAQAQQAMQQGQPPSVKEQIEQTAGLAALQKQMQAQGMQGLMAQARPQGIPENVPQPNSQPESEGVAGLPTGAMYNFKDGGIVAFAAGGDEGMEGLLSPEQLRKQYEQARASGDFQEATRIFKALKEREASAPRTVKVPVAAMDEGTQRPPMPQPQAPIFAEARPNLPSGIPEGALQPPATRAMGAIPAPGGITAGNLTLPGRAGIGQMPVGAPGDMEQRRPQPMMGGIAGIEGADQAQKMLLEAMRAKPTAQGTYESERELAGLYGLKEQYGKERMSRIEQMEAERQKALEGRGMERLMRVMGGVAGRGLQGATPAYLSAIEGERMSDAAFRKQMDELLSGVEEKRRAEQVSRMKGTQEQLTRKEEIALGVAEKISGQQRRREEEMFKFQLEQQLKMMQPNEAAILQQVMADIKRRNPDMPLEEIYGKARAAQQGATPELRQQEQRLKAIKAATEAWNDITVSKAVKNPNNLPEEQWIAQKAAAIERMSKGQYGDIVIPDSLKATAAQYGVK